MEDTLLLEIAPTLLRKLKLGHSTIQFELSKEDPTQAVVIIDSVRYAASVGVQPCSLELIEHDGQQQHTKMADVSHKIYVYDVVVSQPEPLGAVHGRHTFDSGITAPTHKLRCNRHEQSLPPPTTEIERVAGMMKAHRTKGAGGTIEATGVHEEFEVLEQQETEEQGEGVDIGDDELQSLLDEDLVCI